MIKIYNEGEKLMRKNKTLAFALAATLLVGGTFVGTKAWFTETKTVNSGLVISTGSIDLTVTSTEWQAIGTQESTKVVTEDEGSKVTTFSNTRPGDSFEKTITIQNEGTLAQNIKLSGGTLNDNVKDKLTVQYFDANEKDINLAEESIQLNTTNNKSYTIKMKVSVKDDMANENDTIVLNDSLFNAININAEQINRPANN